VQAIEILPAATGAALLCAVEPVALDRLALDQGPDGMHPGPVPGTLDQPSNALLHAVSKDVFETSNLGALLLADNDRPEAPGPDFVTPVDEAADLPGQVGVEVAHEVRELLGAVDPQEQVIVIGQEGEGTDLHFVETLGPGQSTDDDLVERRAWAEKEAALDGAGRDFDQGLGFGNEAERSAHEEERRKKSSHLANFF